MNAVSRMLSADTTKSKLPFRTVILFCGFVMLCYVAAVLGHTLRIPPDRMAAPFWPATAFLAAVLLLVPRRVWPLLIAVGLGAIVASDWTHVPLRSLVWITLGDAVGVVVPAFLVRQMFDGAPHLDTPKALARYSLVAVILAPFLSALVGAQAPLSDMSYWVRWRIWLIADALAFLTVAPAVLTWASQERSWSRNSRNNVELAALMTSIALLGWLVFVRAGQRESPAVLYSLVPLLLLAALRFGLQGASTAIVIIAFLSVCGAAHGRGPFNGEGSLNNALSLQLFLFFTAIPFMFLATLVEERRRANSALRESEERFRLVANTAPVMIWMSGVDMFCTYLNQAWLDFTGRSLEAELGNGWTEGLYPGDLERLSDIETKAVERREPYQMEYRVRRNDGQYRWLLQSGVPRFNPDGSFAGYIGSAIDVTERKLAEENRERFRSVFESSAVGMALVADDGHWIQVNKALCEILGYSEQELLATDFQSLTHPDDLEADLYYAQKVFAGQTRFYHIEKRYIHKQGHVVWVTLTGSAVPDASGKVSYGVAQVQDITARKNAEAALRRDQEELQSLAGRLITVQEEERRRIARDLHDDLSQRLALLCIDLDLLHQSLPGGAEAARELERMRHETDELVRDMRRLSHNEHHPQLALGLHHGVASFCHDFSKQHGIAAKLIHEGDLKQIPETVSFTLFRVLQEAMSNVAKHSGADRVTVRLGVHNGQVLLRVTDQGRGFEIGSGRGLGLISMRERLRLVGGTMRVNSSPLQGTDVEAVVPIPPSGGAVSLSAWA
jgi:PAS domain S-box-containing protein